ncbi:MAG TPA: 2-amino-4-hydroxy-6-hydroxymethyldihydropteridine diphosphokinase [Pirellulaceae bacterium]|nr:2-amino-4-hydroxy-6-hydroxymethyldihydropteridine diphosphokinase [Pirellulaceae bacterium]
MAVTLIALGSNLGDRAGGIDRAIERLAAVSGVEPIAVAPLIETMPIGVPDSDARFYNSAARFDVSLEPQAWLALLLATEQALGRERHVRWGARRIDLDLLLYDERIIDSRPLRVPHPRMAFRRFVMQPAASIAGDLRHPICDATMFEVAEHLDRTANWLWWPAEARRGEGGIRPATAWRELPSGADDDAWQDAARWLNSGEVAGPSARTVVTGDWPDRARAERLGLPRFPKLVVRACGAADPFDRLALDGNDTRPIRMQLPLESERPEEIGRDVQAAIEAMTLL